MLTHLIKVKIENTAYLKFFTTLIGTEGWYIFLNNLKSMSHCIQKMF